MEKTSLASGSAPAKGLMDIARSLAPAGSMERDWSQEEINACAALVLAAIRLKSASRLEAAIEAFGGLPPTKGALIFHCAKDPEAFGFERVLMEYEKLRPRMGGRRGAVHELGEWLREGMPTYFGLDDAPVRQAIHAKAGYTDAPVAACLAADNPVALALVLERPEMREALALLEPSRLTKPLSEWADEKIPEPGAWGRTKALAHACQKAKGAIETSLIWQALESGAFRCVGLLASTPDFGQGALEPGGLSFGSQQTATRRRGQGLFNEEPDPEYSFFEEALMSKRRGNDQHSIRDEEGQKEAWEAMVRACVQFAPESAKSWRQQGTGMGWCEMYFARETPFEWEATAAGGNEHFQKNVARSMQTLRAFDKAGFEAGWEELSACCDEKLPMAAWLGMRGQAGQGNALSNARKAAL